MANYANLKSDIAGVIRTNNNEEITGDILQEQLFNMVGELGAGYQYMGIAIPTTNPGSPDANVFYIASTAGTYTNFGGAVVADGEVAVLKYNGTWTKEVSGAATAAQVTQLGREVEGETIVNSTSANGVKRLLTTALPAGATITSVTGLDSASNRAIILYEDSQDATGLKILVNSDLPVTLAKAYTYWQAYQSGSPTCVMTATVPGMIDKVDDLQDSVDEIEQDIDTLHDKDVLIDDEIAKIKGSINAQMDFSSGSVAQYANRWIPYDFIAGRIYGFNILTEDATINTYFSLRDTNGSTIDGQNNIGTGKGARSFSFECTANAPRLYMSYAASGPSIVYQIQVQDLSALSLVSLDKRVEELETDIAEIQGTTDIVLGESVDISGSANFQTRGFYIRGDLQLIESEYWRMSDPVLVKSGQTLKMRARGTGTKTFGFIGIDSAVPITSILDVRDLSVIDETRFAEQDQFVDFSWTAVEDTYVIIQYYVLDSVTLGYEPINDRVVNVEKTINDINEKLEQEGDLMEEWVKEEISLLVYKLRSLSKDNLVIFAFNTDQHYTQAENGTDVNPAIIRGLKSIPELAKLSPLNLVVLGGDEAGYGGNADNTLQGVADDVAQVVKAGYTSLCPVVAMSGNHDAYQNVGTENSDGYQEFNWKTRGNVARKELDWSGIRSTNSWYDDNIQRVRFVFLDYYSVNQGTELADCIDSALGDNKLKNSDWQVLIFSHNVISAAGTNVTAPMSASVWTQILGYITQGVNIVACINGHAHNITQGVKDGVLMIAVNQALPVTNPSSPAIDPSFDGNTYTNVLESAKETAYQVFAFDRTNNKLYVFQYGAGTDRVFNTTPGSRGIELDVLSGVVSSSETIAGGAIKATNHNTEYSVTLDATGAYSFPYLCPGLAWQIDVALPGGGTASQTYNSATGAHTLNISI